MCTTNKSLRQITRDNLVNELGLTIVPEKAVFGNTYFCGRKAVDAKFPDVPPELLLPGRENERDEFVTQALSGLLLPRYDEEALT